jgi:thiamine-phosphate pyrophosphorylase
MSNYDPQILRILDAAANRAAEGLRVVEDYCRFVLDDRYLTALVKEVRHHLAEALTTLPREDRHAMRETQADVGTTISTPSEQQRTDAAAVCVASCERVKQSLRSLEEFGKTLAPAVSARLEKLRYQFYTLEKALSVRLRLSGSALEQAKLCVLIDGSFNEAKVRAIVAAGVGMIQLRDKTLGDRELLERARLIRDCINDPGQDDRAILIINDRVDIAAAADADGVHLGQDDLPVRQRGKFGAQEELSASRRTTSNKFGRRCLTGRTTSAWGRPFHQRRNRLKISPARRC